MTTLQLVALAFFACACGETNMQAIQRLQAPYQQERQLLGRIAASLPPRGTARESLPARLAPAMVLIDGYYPSSPYAPNTEVLGVETIAAPDHPSYGRPGFQAYLGYKLEHCLAWTGPNNPLLPSARGERGGLGPDCEKALAAPYLVITRLLEESLPDCLHFEAFIFQHRAAKPIGSFVIDLRRAPPKADGTSPPPPADIPSEFHTAGRCALLGRLANIPGATIRSNTRCPAGAFTTEVAPLRRASPESAAESARKNGDETLAPPAA